MFKKVEPTNFRVKTKEFQNNLLVSLFGIIFFNDITNQWSHEIYFIVKRISNNIYESLSVKLRFLKVFKTWEHHHQVSSAMCYGY